MARVAGRENSVGSKFGFDGRLGAELCGRTERRLSQRGKGWWMIREGTGRSPDVWFCDDFHGPIFHGLKALSRRFRRGLSKSPQEPGAGS